MVTASEVPLGPSTFLSGGVDALGVPQPPLRRSLEGVASIEESRRSSNAFSRTGGNGVRRRRRLLTKAAAVSAVLDALRQR